MSSFAKAQRQDKINGILVSVAVHVAILALLFFFIKITPPDPPWEELGLEVNFGFDPAGYGNVSTTETAGETEPQQAQPEKAEEAPLATNDDPDSPVELPEKEDTKKKEDKPNPTKETNKEPEKPTPNTKKGGGANDGNVKGANGNQGDPNGNPDALNYGKKSGSSLQMTGWKWDEPPTPDDKSEATGKIVFEVKVDESGDIVAIKVIERTVDPGVVEKYKKAVEKLTFSKTRDNQNSAETSTGKITFVLKGD